MQLIVVLLLIFFVSFLPVNANNEYAPGELVIKYHNQPIKALTNGHLSTEELIINKINDYLILKPNSNGKLYRKISDNKNPLIKNSKIRNSKVIQIKFEDEGQDLEKLAMQMKHDLDLEEVFPNYLFEINEQPNDPLYSEQWGLRVINAEAAWQKGYSGEGAVVAVIDTGIDFKHRDLKNNIWINKNEIPDNGRDDDNNGYVDDYYGWDFIDDAVNCALGEDCDKPDNNPADFNSHGTHVAGIIAAEGNNQVGLVGVAPGAQVMSLRAAYATSSAAILRSTDVYEAINYAIQQKADIINMSFAGKNMGIISDAVIKASQAGIVLVGAAGNSGNDEMLFPAGMQEVISVGATDVHNDKANFSNYGDWLDIVAPGVAIYSTVPRDQYATKSGTSMAAPFVSGVAAIIVGKNKLGNLDPQDIRQRIINSATKSNFPALVNSNAYIGSLNADIKYPLEVDGIYAPDYAIYGEPITISGAGSDVNFAIVNYDWHSDLDGFLSDQKSFTTSVLSLGTHKIFLKVQNAHGNWSEEQYKTIIVTNDGESVVDNLNDYEIEIKKIKKKYFAKVYPEDAYVSKYSWQSDIDGYLGDHRSLPRKALSQGIHRITVKAQDARGKWSQDAVRMIRVK